MKSRRKLIKSTTKNRTRAVRKNTITQQDLLNGIKHSTPGIALNIDFHRSAEGIYDSYWVGKFINTLQLGGGKKTASACVYKALASVKYGTSANPLIVFLETLDRTKPTFRLRNYIVRRVIIKEYPIVVLRPRRLILAVHWLKEEVRSLTGRFDVPLATRIANQLLEFRANSKKSSLAKKRNDYVKRTVKAQFNIRYTFR